MKRAEDLRGRNLFDELIRLRDEQRRHLTGAMEVISSADIPVEVNQLARTQWYLHPNLHDSVINSLIVAVHSLEPGEASGKLLYQGGTVIFFLAGRGRTTLDDAVYEWQANDLLNVPIREPGVTIQHFNTGTETVSWVEASPNLVHSLGVDRGSGFEVLEPSTAYQKETGQRA